MAFQQGDSGFLPRTHVSRPRLLRKLAQATQGRLTIVCADAGYGKTTLVTEFLASAGIRAECLRLAPVHRDITRFADGLDSSLRRLGSGSEGRPARRFRSRDDQPFGVGVLLESLLKQASWPGPEPALLVLDEYQHVDSVPAVNSLLKSFVEKGPPGLHFLIVSRSAPHLRLGWLMARQEVSVLAEDELAFTQEETSQFLRSESGLDLDDDAVALVHNRTEGWAAGIAAAAQSLRYGRRDRVMSVLADPVASASLVYDYLAEEVFDREEPSNQQFLVRTSILGLMTAEACDYLLDSASSQSALEQLEERGLFTACLDSARRSYRYHQLFREFLRQKLHQRESREAVAALHQKAAQFYERQENWDESIHHYTRSGDGLHAALLVEAVGERYILAGFSQTVGYWLRVLPEDLTATRPWLLALRGRISHMSVRLEDSLRLLERALWLFRAGGDEEGQAWVGGDIGYVKYRLRQLQQAIRHYEVALLGTKPGTMLKSRLLVNEAQAYREAGRLEEAVEACQAAMEEVAGVEDEAARVWCYSRAARVLAHAQAEMGQLETARRGLEALLDFCRAQQIGEYEESWNLANLGIALWATGNFDQALPVLERAFSLSGRHGRHFIGLWLGNSLRDSGRYAEAEKAYSESSREAELEAAYLVLLSGQSRAARSVAGDLYRRFRDSEGIAERTTANVVLGAALRATGELDKALERVREAAALLAAHGYQLRLCSALLHQARLEFDLSMPTDARRTLLHAFDLAASNGYYHFFWWDPDLVASLCEEALGEQICVEYVSDLATRRLASRWPEILTSLAQHRRPEIRRWATSTLSSLPATRGPAAPFLSECSNPSVRKYLLQAIGEDAISAEGVKILRTLHGLSWREVQITVDYYLRTALQPMTTSARMRDECAQRLNISQNTVRSHVNNIRGKLGLPKSLSGRLVLEWAREEGLLSGSTPPADSDPSQAPLP
jgi:ATP/maltotriose-dependent transcriptional regulator MalT